MNKEENEDPKTAEMQWDPDDAKKMGSLKGIAEFKIEAEHTETKIEFSEPKIKKKVRTTAKVVEIGRKNKNSLF